MGGGVVRRVGGGVRGRMAVVTRGAGRAAVGRKTPVRSFARGEKIGMFAIRSGARGLREYVATVARGVSGGI